MDQRVLSASLCPRAKEAEGRVAFGFLSAAPSKILFLFFDFWGGYLICNRRLNLSAAVPSAFNTALRLSSAVAQSIRGTSLKSGAQRLFVQVHIAVSHVPPQPHTWMR
jgi:hypothetical protein